MMATELDGMIFTEIVGDHPIPCDFANDDQDARPNPCPGDPAAWIMLPVPCCGRVSSRLACTHCKDVRLYGVGAVECGNCGHVTFPASAAYLSIEPLQ